jgi:FAD binding domain
VVAAVRFARAHDLLVAVRGGGHNVAGNGTCDGGMVIDLSPMKGVRVDPARRRVWAQAGLVWRELDRETQQFGLAVTGGLVSSTGIAGFTLGGGIGWLQRKHGLAIDNLVAADLVTDDGEVLHASADDHPDLLWGCAAAAGTSAWSPPSSSSCTRSARRWWPGWCSIPARTCRRWPAASGTSWGRHPTRSRSRWSCVWPRRRRSCPRRSTAGRWWLSPGCTPGA